MKRETLFVLMWKKSQDAESVYSCTTDWKNNEYVHILSSFLENKKEIGIHEHSGINMITWEAN